MSITSREKKNKSFRQKFSPRKPKQINRLLKFVLAFFSPSLKWVPNFLGKQFTAGLPSLSVHSVENYGNWITQFFRSPQKVFFMVETHFARTPKGASKAKQFVIL
jgi:hypothetical protein